MKPAAIAGQLRVRVRFDMLVETPDPAGGSSKVWEEQFTHWAAIKPLRGGEDVQAQRLQGLQPVLIVVRKDSQTKAIEPSWRAVELLSGVAIRYYALKTAEDMERQNRFITMLAVSGAADS